jgi:hypothetical protein
MSAAEVLAAIEERARTYSGVGYPHEGDCAGSLCEDCGHCLHSIEPCSCEDCGCEDFVDDDEVLMKRDTLRAVAALQAVLFQCSGEGDNVYRDDNYGTGSRVICVDVVEAAIDAALGVEP